MPQTFIKDPESVLDFQCDWSDWMAAGDSISTSSWAAEAGITVDSDSNTAATATVWLSGGTAGNSYNATNTIVTSQGRTDERTIVVKVRER